MAARLRDERKVAGWGRGGREVGGIGVGGRRGGEIQAEEQARGEGGSVGGLRRCVCAWWWGECLYDGRRGGLPPLSCLRDAAPSLGFPFPVPNQFPLVWFRPR